MRHVKVSRLRQDLRAAKVARGGHVRMTSREKAIAEIVPAGAGEAGIGAARARLRGSVLRFDHPLDPVVDWAELRMNR